MEHFRAGLDDSGKRSDARHMRQEIKGRMMRFGLHPARSAPEGERVVERLQRIERENDVLREMVRYLYYWSIRADENIRDITAKIGGLDNAISHTHRIFDDKWQMLNQGTSSLENPQHKADIENVVLRWTGLPKRWFPGKRALDAGCGDGRLSYGLCRLGAEVTSIDQSPTGVQRTNDYCRKFEGHNGYVHDLLQPLPRVDYFDLILSFGVVHCTGDTRNAIRNLAAALKRGGYMALMVYGYPRLDNVGDFVHMNRKEYVRQAVRHMDSDEVVEFIREWMQREDIQGDLRGWFDATMPQVEDHYTFPQLALLMREAGLIDIQRLNPELRNLCALGRKP